MAKKAENGNSTSDARWWFLNPELARLAADERRFFAAWTHDEEAAEDLLLDSLARRSIAWYAELEFEMRDLGLQMPAGSPIPGLPISYAAVWLGFWVDPSCLGINWKASSAIYTGPTLLLRRNSDGREYVFFDSRTPVRIIARLIRFRHEDGVRQLCARGLMPRSDLPVPRPPPEKPPGVSTKAWVTSKAQWLKRNGEIPDAITKTAFARALAGENWKYVRNNLEEWSLWPVSVI